jgi:glutathione S-transferase
MSKIKLYVLPASHPCVAVEAALKLKSIPYDRIDLLPLSQLAVGPLRYGGNTVPGIRINGERIVGSRPIMRRLEELEPEPALLPPEDPARAQVLEVERWGDEELQPVPRRLLPRAFVLKPALMESFLADDVKLPLPRPLLRPGLPLTARLMAIRAKASDEGVHAALSALPAQLDQIDAWIADGPLGGDQPNAADLQIGATIRLLLAIADARTLIAGRPAEQLTRYFPPMVGEVPAGTLPEQSVPAAA